MITLALRAERCLDIWDEQNLKQSSDIQVFDLSAFILGAVNMSGISQI